MVVAYKEALQNLKYAAKYDSLYHEVIRERADAEIAETQLASMHE